MSDETRMHVDLFWKLIDEILNAVLFLMIGLSVMLLEFSTELAITGTLARPDDAALARLGLTGSILLVKATFSISIGDTALAANAMAFDGDVIPIAVSLVLRHTGR